MPPTLQEKIEEKAKNLFIQNEFGVLPWGEKKKLPVDLTREYIRHEVQRYITRG